MLPSEHDVLILVYVLARETWHGSTEVRHRRLTIVDQVAHEKLISRAQYFVDAKDSVIFAGGLQQGSREQRQSAAEFRTIRQWIERQQRRGPDVNSHENKLPLSVWQEPIVHVGVRHGKTVRDALTLTQSFVVDEEECLVVNDGPAKTGAELVANIPRFAYIKKVAGIEHGIANKFVGPSMPVIRARFRYVLYVGAPVAPILCVVGIQYNAVFLDGIYSQLYSRRAARWNIESRIVNVAAIQGIVGHRRARSISSNFGDIAFGERIRTRVRRGCDADLQLDKLRKVPAIERQLRQRPFRDHSTHL